MAISGVMKTDEKLPSVRELAVMLSINPNTIQRAYRELEMEGCIYSVRAKGSFISPVSEDTLCRHKEKLFEKLKKDMLELKAAGVSDSEIEDWIKAFIKEDRAND